MQQGFLLNEVSDPGTNAEDDVVAYEYPTPFARWNGLVLIGEAPGAEEVRQGKPFVGRSGQLLNKILVRAKIRRDEIIIANVFRKRPPDNKVDYFFLSNKKAVEQKIAVARELGRFGSVFCKEEFAGEITFLGQTLEKLRKERGTLSVVTLGRTPFWALTGESGLLQKVGVPAPSRLVEGLTVTPTFHPSFILRGNWNKEEEWLSHFIQARAIV